MLLLNVLAKVAPPDQGLDLVLELVAFLDVMAMVMIEMTVFSLASFRVFNRSIVLGCFGFDRTVPIASG